MNNPNQHTADLRGTTLDPNIINNYLTTKYHSLATPAQKWTILAIIPPTKEKPTRKQTPKTNKIKPLFVADLGPDTDVDEIRRNFKPMPKNSSFLKLIGSLSGPGDMSTNKRKYIAEHAEPTR